MNVRHKRIFSMQLKNESKEKTLDLCKENLSLNDYHWLINTLKNSPHTEHLILPTPEKVYFPFVLDWLDILTKTNSIITSIEFNHLPADYIEANENKWMQIQSRLNRNKKRIFGIHGGGNIGLGLMADIICKSPHQYHVVATSNNAFVRELINRTNKYWLKHGDNEETTCITDVKIISRDSHDVINLYATANQIALCVTENVFNEIVDDIARGLIARYETDGAGLKLWLLMNLPNSEKIVFNKIKNTLLQLTGDEVYTQKIMTHVICIPTVIDRIVRPMKKEEILSQIKAQLKEINAKSFSSTIAGKYPSLFFPPHHMFTDVEKLLNNPLIVSALTTTFNLEFNLFNAEEKFLMYAPDNQAEIKRFPLINRVNNLEMMNTVKNKLINGPHAVIAWLGGLLGCKTIAKAIQHPRILAIINQMIDNEIIPILMASYDQLSLDDLIPIKNNFLTRCKDSKDDEPIRVGRDPMRKMDKFGCIRGTIEMAKEKKLDIATPALETGLAAGTLYALHKVDPNNQECKQLRNIFKTQGYSYKQVLCYQGPTPTGQFNGFHPIEDASLVNNILGKINNLEQHIANINPLSHQAGAKNDKYINKDAIWTQPFYRFGNYLWHRVTNIPKEISYETNTKIKGVR